MNGGRALAVLLLVTPLISGCVSDPKSSGADELAEEIDDNAAGPRANFTGMQPADFGNMEVAEVHESAVAALQAAGKLELMMTREGYDRVFPAPRTESVAFIIEESDLLQNYWVEIDGQPANYPFMAVYEGHVEDFPDQPFRLTISDDWVRGMAIVDGRYLSFRLNMSEEPLDDWIEPDSAEAPANDTPPDCTEFTGQQTVDARVRGFLAEWDFTTTLVGPSQDALVELDVILDAGARFYNHQGPGVFPWMVAIAAETDAILNHELGAGVRIVGLHAQDVHLARPDSNGLIEAVDQLAGSWNARPEIVRDHVTLLELGLSVGGRAYCLGGALSQDTAYVQVNLDRENQRWNGCAVGSCSIPPDTAGPIAHQALASPAMTAITLAHEWGHLYHGIHEYGVTAGAPAVAGVKGTIMGTGASGLAEPVFTPMNRIAIRGGIEQYDRDPAAAT